MMVSALSPTNIETLIIQARKACSTQDYGAMDDFCKEILQIEPHHNEALLLQAQFGSWDPKLLTFDIQAVLRLAQDACASLQETEWFSAGTNIYMARKKQVALQLEAALMMPSYTGAKQLHKVMQTWLTLLAGLPYLHVSLIESEIILCTNVCTRSKRGIMPNDRLVYTAYSTLNEKESYSDTFKRILQPRLEQQKNYEAHLHKEIQDHIKAVQDALGTNQSTSGALSTNDPISSQTDIQHLHDYYRTVLEQDIAKITQLTNRHIYQQQIDELTEQRKKTKSYKIKRHRDITMRITTLEKNMAEIDNELAPLLNPLYHLISQLQR